MKESISKSYNSDALLGGVGGGLGFGGGETIATRVLLDKPSFSMGGNCFSTPLLFYVDSRLRDRKSRLTLADIHKSMYEWKEGSL